MPCDRGGRETRAMASPRTEDVAAQVIEIAWTWASPVFEHGLTSAERARYHRLRRRVDKDMFATGRALLRLVVGARLGIEPHEVVVHARCARCGSPSHGAPTVDQVDRARAAPHVSVSHAAGLVMVAVTDLGPVGVDCEPLDSALVSGFAGVALAPHERAALADAPSEALLRTWVRKEALLKATGRGLATDPRAVVLSPWPDPPQVISAPGGITPNGWQLADVDPVPGYLGAVASASARFGDLQLAVRRVNLGPSDIRAASAASAAKGT